MQDKELRSERAPTERALPRPWAPRACRESGRSLLLATLWSGLAGLAGAGMQAEESASEAGDEAQPEPVADPLGRESVGRALGQGSDNRVDYVIDARLERWAPGDADPPRGVEADSAIPRFRLDGRLELAFTHRGTEPLDELWFHAYLNAYSNNRSTHLLSAKGMLRGVRMREGWGFLDVDAVRLQTDGDPLDLTAGLTWESPTYPNSDDRTVFRVALPEPLEPGATARVELEWNSLLPRVRRRTGTMGDFLLMSHWFPKLAVHESGRGWNAHPFHAFTEFYADFGTYDVTLDLPADYADQVFASGRRANEVVRGDRVEVRFLAPSADDREREDASGREPLLHDFAIAADPEFVASTYTFHYDDWAARFPDAVDEAAAAFGEDARLELPDVTVEVLMQPEHEVQAERHFEATAAALFFYGLWYGEYPFERLTVVDPAWGASAAGGMEYPTLFTSGTRMFTEPWMHRPEGVTVHEAGHQWFQGLVANNEFEAAWMDEGLNSFTDSEVLYRWLGESSSAEWYSGLPIRGCMLSGFGSGVSGRLFTAREMRLPRLDWIGLARRPRLRPVRASGILDWWREQPLLSLAPERTDPRWSDRRRYLSSPDRDPIDTWAFGALDRNSHYTNTYARTATVLRSLPAVISGLEPETDGWAAMRRGMRGYATDWRFRHPYPQDFFTSFAEASGVGADLEWVFEDLFRGTGTIDWAVSVSQSDIPDPSGLFLGEDGEFAPVDAPEDEVEPPQINAVGDAGQSAGESPAEVALQGDPSDAPASGEGAAGEGAGDNGDAADGAALAVDAESSAEPETLAESDVEPLEVPEQEALAEDGEPVEIAESEEPTEPARTYEVSVRRAGSLALPVPIRLEWSDGRVEEFMWTRAEQLESRWWRRRFDSAERLVAVQVDPEGGYFLETDRSNNGWFPDQDDVAPLRWAERFFTQVAHRLHWQKGLGG